MLAPGERVRENLRASVRGTPRAGRKLNGWTVLAYVLLTLGAVVMIFPFVWMVLSSFKDAREVLAPGILPREWTLANYIEVLTRTAFPRWFANSMIVAVLNTTSVLFFCALVGYTLATMKFPGKNIIFIAILSTLMVPTEMLVIPWFVMSAQLGWVDTYWGLLFPGLIPGFGVFLMRQFFMTLPRDLFDAARIDGVSEFGLFMRIGLPLVGPGLAALGIFAFIGNWNAFLWPLIVAQSASMRTVPVGIALFSGEAGSAWHLIMATSALGIIPILVVFVIFQRQIIEGVVLTGVKG
jgi:multiple sugar transport system permease protein